MSVKRDKTKRNPTHHTQIFKGATPQIGDTFAHIPVIHEAFPGGYVNEDVGVADVAMKDAVLHFVSTAMT